MFLHRVDATGYLDIDAYADTELHFVATFTSLGLFSARFRIFRDSHCFVECGLVVANIICMTDFGFMCLHEFWNQVQAANFGRVFADLGGKEIHRTFDRCGRFWSTSATVGDNRCRICNNRSRSAFHFFNVIDALSHWSSHERCEHGANFDPATRILNCIQLICSHSASFGATDCDVLQLCTTVPEADH